MEELESFDDTYFKDVLIKLLREASSEVRAGFAWQFWQLPANQEANFDEFFAISYKYLLVITEGAYDHNVIHDIYYFIEEYLDKKYEECIDLWKKCLSIEGAYLKANVTKDNLYDMHWWPHHYNGKVLERSSLKNSRAIIEGRRAYQEYLKPCHSHHSTRNNTLCDQRHAFLQAWEEDQVDRTKYFLFPLDYIPEDYPPKESNQDRPVRVVLPITRRACAPPCTALPMSTSSKFLY